MSINIPTLNSARTLEKTLQSVVGQTYRNCELIVIDAYSRDDTVAIAEKYGAKVLFAEGLLNQRLKGIKESKGKFVLLLDSDQVLDHQAIERCLQRCKEGYDALIMPEVSVWKEGNFISKILAYNKILPAPDSDVMFGNELPRFVRASLLKKVKPSLDDVGYLDHIIIYYELLRVGARIGYAQTMVYHHELDSLRGVTRKYFRYYGLNIVPASKYYTRLVFARSLPKRSFLLGRLRSDPRVFAGLVFLYSLKAMATLTGAFCYVTFDMAHRFARLFFGR